MKKIIIFLVLVSLIKPLFATAQSPDVLIYNGKDYSIATNPLEIFFSAHPHRKPKTNIHSSGLWRGYVATLQIQDNSLYLKDIKVMYRPEGSKPGDRTKWKSVIKDTFPKLEDRVCSFYSGLLILRKGKVMHYVHMGYSSVYENYTLLRIKNGKLMKEKHLSGKEYFMFKKRQFKEYQKSDEYEKSVERMLKDGGNISEIEKFLFDYEIDYTGKYLLDEI